MATAHNVIVTSNFISEVSHAARRSREEISRRRIMDCGRRLVVGKCWLPIATCSKNFESEFILDLDAFRKRRRPRELKLPPVVGHLKLAEEFQRLLDSGEAPNRASLARQHGLTRARVTQLMDLLLLHAEILDYVRNLPAGTPDRLVTERNLRGLVRLAPQIQVREAERKLAGFAAHCAKCHRAAG